MAEHGVGVLFAPCGALEGLQESVQCVAPNCLPTEPDCWWGIRDATCGDPAQLSGFWVFRISGLDSLLRSRGGACEVCAGRISLP